MKVEKIGNIEITEKDLEHIRNCVKKGYSSGEFQRYDKDGSEITRGCWEFRNKRKKLIIALDED